MRTNWKQIIGILILILVFFSLIGITAYCSDWMLALKAWGASVVLTGIIVGAVFLIFDQSK